MDLFGEAAREIPAATFEQSGLRPGADMGRLWELLEQGFAGEDPAGSADELRILDLACGACEEAVTLSAFVRRRLGATASRIEFCGVDVRERQIGQARRRCEGLQRHLLGDQPPGRFFFRFLHGDATRLEQFGESVPDQADLVFLRHQNIWNGAAVWAAIFDQALLRLKPEGWLVITSYYDVEHRAAIQMLGGLGARCRLTVANPYTRDLDRHGKSIDRHLAVFRGPGGGG